MTTITLDKERLVALVETIADCVGADIFFDADDFPGEESKGETIEELFNAVNQLTKLVLGERPVKVYTKEYFARMVAKESNAELRDLWDGQDRDNYTDDQDREFYTAD